MELAPADAPQTRERQLIDALRPFARPLSTRRSADALGPEWDPMSLTVAREALQRACLISGVTHGGAYAKITARPANGDLAAELEWILEDIAGAPWETAEDDHVIVQVSAAAYMRACAACGAMDGAYLQSLPANAQPSEAFIADIDSLAGACRAIAH